MSIHRIGSFIPVPNRAQLSWNPGHSTFGNGTVPSEMERYNPAPSVQEAIMTRFRLSLLGVLVVVVSIWAPGAAQRGAPADGQWRNYSGDLGGTKYSPLSQIDK